MTSKSALVREALPDLINLLDIFQKVVTGEIENYNETKDILQLRHVILPLKKDLENYKQNFDAWYQTAKTAQDYQDLEELAKHLGEAQNTLYKAEQLLRA